MRIAKHPSEMAVEKKVGGGVRLCNRTMCHCCSTCCLGRLEAGQSEERTPRRIRCWQTRSLRSSHLLPPMWQHDRKQSARSALRKSLKLFGFFLEAAKSEALTSQLPQEVLYLLFVFVLSATTTLTCNSKPEPLDVMLQSRITSWSLASNAHCGREDYKDSGERI